LAENSSPREKLKEGIRQHPHLSASDLHIRLGVTEVDVMEAMADQAVEVPVADLDTLLEQVRLWGQVLSLIRNQDAVSELKFPANSLYRQGDWLNSIDPAYNLHIRIAATHRILLLIRSNHKRDGRTYSVNFANPAGAVFWRLYAKSEPDQRSFRNLMKVYSRELNGTRD
jgi:putative heme iron utilization protein